MMKYIVVVLALVAVAASQIVYSNYANGANLHGPYAASTSTGIRRYGSTGGFIANAYAAPYAATYAAPYAATYASPYAATYASPYAATYAI